MKSCGAVAWFSTEATDVPEINLTQPQKRNLLCYSWPQCSRPIGFCFHSYFLVPPPALACPALPLPCYAPSVRLLLRVLAFWIIGVSMLAIGAMAALSARTGISTPWLHIKLRFRPPHKIDLMMLRCNDSSTPRLLICGDICYAPNWRPLESVAPRGPIMMWLTRTLPALHVRTVSMHLADLFYSCWRLRAEQLITKHFSKWIFHLNMPKAADFIAQLELYANQNRSEKA